MMKKIKKLGIGLLTSAVLATTTVSVPIYAADDNISCCAVTTVPGYYMCMADELNIRKGPGTGYDIVGTLTFGQTVYVTWCKSGWAKIATDRYVSARYLSELIDTK